MNLCRVDLSMLLGSELATQIRQGEISCDSVSKQRIRTPVLCSRLPSPPQIDIQSNYHISGPMTSCDSQGSGA